jgi:cephalosporin-C deacetylase-like acetyl esterase
VPGDSLTASFIWDSEADVIAARRYLASLEAIDEERIAIVGASYSGEEMAEAGRDHVRSSLCGLVAWIF